MKMGTTPNETGPSSSLDGNLDTFGTKERGMTGYGIRTKQTWVIGIGI